MGVVALYYAIRYYQAKNYEQQVTGLVKTLDRMRDTIVKQEEYIREIEKELTANMGIDDVVEHLNELWSTTERNPN